MDEHKMIDIVIPLGNGSSFDNDELRIALRSIERHVAEVRNVFVVSDCAPVWLSGVIKIDAQDFYTNNKDANLFNKVLTAALRSDLSEEFLLWSDDQVALAPIALNELNVWNNRGPAAFATDKKWHRRMTATFQYLKARGKELNYNWDSHTPHVHNKRDVIRILSAADYATAPGFCLDTLLLGSVGRERGVEQATVKLTAESETGDDGWNLTNCGKTFVGYNDSAFRTGLREELFQMFPKASRWEKNIEANSIGGIDVVVTTVDPNDPLWRASLSTTINIHEPENHCRYRNYETLKFFFRGIEKNMPWVRKIHLVVASESQIPEWLDRNNPRLNIVLHSDYIPKDLLPCFNSNPIELFFYRIPELSERFVYFNDDVFALNSIQPDDFFDAQGLPRALKRPRSYHQKTQFKKMLCNNVALLQTMYPEFYGFDYDHLAIPLRKSLCREIVEKKYDKIMESLIGSPTRQSKNVTGYLLKDYQILRGYWSPKKITGAVVQMKNGTIFPPLQKQIVCYNDTKAVGDGFQELKTRLLANLYSRLPLESKFEKKNDPALTMQAFHYAGAIAKHVVTGFKTRSDEEVGAIFTICQSCEYFIQNRCQICGCRCNKSRNAFLNKLRMESQHCPKKKF